MQLRQADDATVHSPEKHFPCFQISQTKKVGLKGRDNEKGHSNGHKIAHTLIISLVSASVPSSGHSTPLNCEQSAAIKKQKLIKNSSRLLDIEAFLHFIDFPNRKTPLRYEKSRLTAICCV